MGEFSLCTYGFLAFRNTCKAESNTCFPQYFSPFRILVFGAHVLHLFSDRLKAAFWSASSPEDAVVDLPRRACFVSCAAVAGVATSAASSATSSAASCAPLACCSELVRGG